MNTTGERAMQFLLTSQKRAFRAPARQRVAISSTLLTAATLSILTVGESSFGLQDRDRARIPATVDLVSDQNQPAEPIVTMWPEPRPLLVANEGGIAGAPSATFLNSGSLPEADGPDDVVYTPDGNTVLVVHRDTDNVTFIDVNSRSVTHT